MGYVDGLTNAWFKKMEDGSLIFYPYGKFGMGYILSEDNAFKIKQFLKRYYMISLPIISVAVILSKLYAGVVLLFLIPFYSIKIRRMLSHSEKISERMKLREVIKNMAISMGVPTSILMLVGSLSMTSAFVFYIFLPNARLLIGILGILFFGLCLSQSIFLVRYSIKFKKRVNKDTL